MRIRGLVDLMIMEKRNEVLDLSLEFYSQT